MQNKIPQLIPALLAVAGKASNGAGLYGTTIPLVLNTKANIDADVLALTDKIMGYNGAKNELSQRRSALADLVDMCRTWIVLGRDTFKPTLGARHNARWPIVGLNRSLKVPVDPMEVLRILLAIKAFLTDNPSLETASLQITAAHADTLATQLETAVTAVQQQEQLVEAVFGERKEKVDVLRKRMADLIAELKIKLDGLDSRWTGFGLNKPDAEQTPDQVEGVKATLIGPTAAAMKWDAAARADYYRVWKKVVGVDAEPVAVGSPADLDFTLENLPAGSTIEIYVSAVNNGGEGALSEKVTLTTHP